MMLNELVDRLAHCEPSPTDLERTSERARVSLHERCDLLAREIADGYLRGRYSWELGDAAMNHLYALAYTSSDFGLPDFAWQVFGAFDEGEYIHEGEPPKLDGEPRTRALLLPLLQTRA